jgi:hypothetical protein
MVEEIHCSFGFDCNVVQGLEHHIIVIVEDNVLSAEGPTPTEHRVNHCTSP